MEYSMKLFSKFITGLKLPKETISHQLKRISSILTTIKSYGLFKTLGLFHRKFSRKRIGNYRLYQKIFCNKCGIEIGGPSVFFKINIPIYHKIKSLDGVNFSSSTIWEGELFEGKNYKYGEDKTGYQFICDTINLDRIESNKYDFILSCNNLEHIANPFKALTEWLRIIKQDGLLLLVLPNKASNFDHNRDVTSLEHLIEDFQKNISEEDLTHLNEILTLHDLSMDKAAGDFDNFKKRSINNFQNRCLHHHVFDMALLEQIFKYFNIEILLKESTKTVFILVGRKFL
jgi:SAM-dependent methyltransferase